MTTSTTTTTYTISASNQKIGRLASEIAMILMGKNTPAFEKHVVANVSVMVSDIDKMHITDKQQDEKTYKRYSGHPGGQTVLAMKQVVAKHGYGRLLEHAVYGMLPANKLRKLRMKNLIIS